ncbi:flagellar motor switch protein FliG [Spongiibacter taiwanensis]|uniref:flagellar motor switch protein FliG n=1 Tax=Spongiibacter taiwanensis TaxID=1748242 RepID=UPI002035ED40|nr:flagellar motor switch protein FliG [Spongiibacter taiwanensis]USA43796.1 flagellar motor switch protein FliG [Spongiibacter taiwanensis]
MASLNAMTVAGSEKAALLLLMLGEDQAAKVLKHVDAVDVEKIGSAMASIRDVDNRKAESVVNEFHRALSSENTLGVGVSNYVRKVLTNTLGEQKGATLADRVLGQEQALEIDSLRWLETEALVQMLKDEHPQIIAITLAHLAKEQAAKVLKALPTDLQENVVMRIATMQTIPQAAMKQLQDVLKKKLSVSASFKTSTVDGAMTAASIINSLDADSETRVLEALAKADEALSDRIQDLMFVFSNLMDIADKGIQMLLREVPSDILPIALKGAEERVRDKILNNMSKRAKEMIIEDMEARGPIKISEVEEAQKEILAIARKLAESGQIDLGKGGDDYV